MSDNTPRPEDDNPPVPPAAEAQPQQPESPAAPSQPASAYPPPADPYGTPPAAGAPVPPPGAYPPPPPGAYPPPYGAPPAGYPQPAGVDIGSGFSWAWKAFTQNALAFVIGTLLWAVVIGVVWSVVFAVFGGFSRLADNAGASYFAVASTGFAGIASTLLSSLLSGLFIASLLGAAFKVADGRAVSVGDLFDFSAISPKFVLALLFAIASLVAGLIPFLGALLSLAIYYFGFFAFHLLVDRARPPVDSIKESIALQTKDWGSSILTVVITWVITFVGALVCGIGLLVAIPVAALFTVYSFRRLTGGTVTARA
ncbi:MAG: hypothetical protein NVV70_07020 [Cellulomonas sp.]|uniref:Integral membrane protein n=1 Tax=Cellulomonas gelida TaxID=1712 RepID=A0A4Y3KHH3_9CELL|nr:MULTISPECIES: hypothetical protein [Cellulomonas]MCR6647890.1 hypothetical protein [Cellulomonas sp.]MCR6703823.1 hypothetical protein [Cellulomonas sp.]GEA83871.1 hypothetical protein CGE01nite_11220 [Cellulomonas gelida]GGL25445.1 hypothetical protein GCM10009774_14820 [Cellulomonas gelida]